MTTTVTPGEPTFVRWAYRVVLLALLGLTIFGLVRLGAFPGLSASVEGNRAATVSERLTAVETTLRLQSTALGQALGQAVPVELAQSAGIELASLEKAVATQEQWPTDAAQVKALNERLLALLKPLPPWAQDTLLPRLLPLKWSIHSHWILRSEVPKKHAELSIFDTNLQAHLNQVPDGVSEPLRAVLKERATAVRSSLRAAALVEAREAITAQQTERAAALLGSYDGPEDDASKKLRADLKSLALSNSVDQTVKEAQTLLTQADPNRSDKAFVEQAVRRVQHTLMDVRSRLALEGASLQKNQATQVTDLEKAVSERLAGLERARQTDHAEKVKDYQKLVLESLNKIRDVKTIEKSGDAKRLGRSERQILADEVIANLAWVDKALLDVAVYEWFHTVYRRSFDALDDVEKKRVVGAFAVTPKRGF